MVNYDTLPPTVQVRDEKLLRSRLKYHRISRNQVKLHIIMWPDIFYLVVFSLIGHHAFASANCPLDEYRVGIECCPSCPPGWLVEKDCAERSMTKCSMCPGGTFQAGRNKLKQCSTCTKCDAGLGLKEKKSCSSTSDAECEVLDGFFCSDSNRGGCRTAQRHMVCSPGQYNGQRGAADKDTECLPCADGTFSDGTSSSCQPHTRCESVGLELMKPGTDSTDSECGEHTQVLKAVISGTLLIGIFTVLFMGYCWR
ncbi:tumor necrosis factor receptor superfamily member 14 [Gadus morhua]|nr:tumor necrosis factor receptor superfamily member 14-like [Gadus morhua]